MTWLALVGIGAAVIALLVMVTAFVGWRMPKDHVASRQARLSAAPEIVWHAITDVDRYSEWRDGVSRVERLPDRAGKTTWVEHGRHGPITFVVDRADRPRRLVVRIADPDLPFGGAWTYEISPAPEGSVLAITENGEIYNPIFRFMARFVFGHDGTLAAYLASLEHKLSGDVRR